MRYHFHGYYVGDVDTRWLPNGRDMALRADFTYIDPAGRAWRAPAGHLINGASVPRFFWRVFAPYVGPWRRASVIHDAACDLRQRPWREVHAAFYRACRADGTGPLAAFLLWLAVRLFGPRWEVQ